MEGKKRMKGMLRFFLVKLFCFCSPGSIVLTFFAKTQLQSVSSIVLICESTSLISNKLFSYSFINCSIPMAFIHVALLQAPYLVK
jgi:hypothetical protein